MTLKQKSYAAKNQTCTTESTIPWTIRTSRKRELRIRARTRTHKRALQLDTCMSETAAQGAAAVRQTLTNGFARRRASAVDQQAQGGGCGGGGGGSAAIAAARNGCAATCGRVRRRR
eukprot:5512891-Prymnesium_polylepis.1